MTPEPTVGAPGDGPTRRAGRLRWGICALVFAATAINYIDRQMIGILKPELSKALGWSQIDYSNIVFAFQLAYAIGYLLAGRMMDRIGVRMGFALAVLAWTLAAMAHGLIAYVPRQAGVSLDSHSWIGSAAILLLYGSSAATAIALPVTVIMFAAARFGLGLAEGGNYPAGVKTMSEWFPARERATATGIFSAGSTVGAMITPMIVPWITVHFGWPTAFYATGALGFFWLAAWWAIYRSPEEHPRLSEAERAYIQSDPPDPPGSISWWWLLCRRQTWVFVVGMFFTAPIWWFYLFWIPGFLHDRHGLNLLQTGPPLVVIYLMTDVGGIAGGWTSSRLIARGWSVNAARKIVMLICALLVVPVFAASAVSNVWAATLLIGLAASAHQGFAANMFTLVPDTVPRRAVSSVVGIGGMAGAVGGLLIAKVTGYILEWTGSYLPLFAMASVAYLVALLIMHLLNPKLAPMAVAASGDGASSETTAARARDA